MLIVFGSSLLCCGLWNCFIYNFLGAEKGEIREAFSIPLQAFARVYKYHYDELSSGDKNSIQKFLPDNNLGDKYVSYLSDDVKVLFDEKAYNSDKISFFKLYFKLFLRYPRTVIEAFICNNYGYYYPNVNFWKIFTGIADIDLSHELGLHENPIIKGGIIRVIRRIPTHNEIPFISVFFNIGICFDVVLLLFGFNLYKKNYKMLIIYIPIILLWLTCLASPVFAEFRYIYGMFLSIPILLLSVVEKKNDLS